MHDALIMCHAERTRELLADREHRRRRQLAIALQQIEQRRARDVFHREEIHAIAGANIKRSHNAAMGDAARESYFTFQSLDCRRIFCDSISMQRLERDYLTEFAIQRLVHDARTAGAEY